MNRFRTSSQAFLLFCMYSLVTDLALYLRVADPPALWLLA
jgi:hypothetical protein